MFQRFFSILQYCKTWSHITVSNESQNVLKGTSVGRYSALQTHPTPHPDQHSMNSDELRRTKAGRQKDKKTVKRKVKKRERRNDKKKKQKKME